MRKLLILGFLIFMASHARATCSGSGLVWSCTSGSTAANIQTAVNSASDNAVITFASGSYSISSEVSLDNRNGITLACATVGGCTITVSSNNAFTNDTCALAGKGNLFRITGFNFAGTVGTAAIWIYGNCDFPQVRIDHNDISIQGSAIAILFGEITNTGRIFGVVDHNNCHGTSNFMCMKNISGGPGTWLANAEGTANNMFFEDNTCNFNTMPDNGTGCMDVWRGNGTVVRFNNMFNGRVVNHSYCHEGPYNSEVYGNTINTPGDIAPQFRNIHFQGSGQELAFGNTVETDGTTGITVQHFRGDSSTATSEGDCNSLSNGTVTGAGTDAAHANDGNRAPTSTNGGYPSWRQPGRDVNATLKPVYVFMNHTVGGTKVDMNIGGCGGAIPSCYIPAEFALNRDYFNAVSASAQTSQISPFNGTTGVGFGTLANRPTTCTNSSQAQDAGHGGVGYWATDQGNWNLSGNGFGQGRLYTCTATNTWTLAYTPYTYPHPLVGSGGSTSNSNFSQTNTCTSTLTASSSCTITVFFNPTVPGTLTGNLTVASNATSSPNISTLTGVGTTPPTITVSPSAVNFGSIRVGTPSTTGIVVSNTGGVPVTINSISTASPFSQTNNCPASLGSGLNCTVNVTATPSATGTVNGSLSISDTANGSPHTASLSVNGIAPVVSLTPASIAFGSQPLNTASAVQNYTLANTGTASLTFSVALAGASPTDYVLGALGCTSPLPAGQNCLIPVQFKPANLGSRTAILQVTDNASGSPHTSTMSGTGIVLTPAVCLSTASIAFGNQPVNTTSGSQPITVTNCGQANLNVASIPPTITNIDQYPSPGFTSPSCSPQSVGGIWCGKQDAGIPMGTATGSTALVTTPSTSGHARQFVANISGSAGFRFSSYLGPTILNPTSTHFTYHTHLRVDDATQASHFEFDLYQGLLNGDTIIYGVQCSFLSGKWEYTTALNPTTSQWTASNLACSAATFPANTYIDLIFAYHRVAGVVTYESVTINGVTSNFSGASGNSEFTIGFVPIGLGIVNFQIDGLAGATTTTAYLDGLSIAGATPTSPFAQTNNCVGTPVVPNGTCVINTTFSPTLPGSVASQMVLNSDAASSPDIMQLSGSGTQTGATLSPAAVDFGSITVGQVSTNQTMTVTNTGNTSLSVLTPILSGANPGDFTSGACPPTLAPNAFCTYAATFAPTGAGARSATLTQPFGNGVASVTSSFTGTGVSPVPAVTITPLTWDFGNVTTGVTSASKTFQLSNSGNATLNITSITFTGANLADYAMTNHCGATLAAGNVCTVDVTVTPGGTGARVANLHFLDDAIDSPQDVALTTNGVAAPAPKVSLSTAALSFSPPSIQTGTTSASQSITVTNMGNANLVVSSVTLTGANTGDYVQTNNCTTVAGGSSCAVTVNFKPTLAGSRTASVSIASNATSSPDVVTLSGTGFVGTPNLVLAISTINFGNQTVGTTSAPAAFTITNNGLATATGVVISAVGDFATTTTTCGSSITQGSTCSVNVTFTPLILCGQFDPNNPATCISFVHLGQVSVVSNTSNSPQTVALQGTAIPVPPPPGPIIMSMGGKAKIGGKTHTGSH